MLLQQYPSSQLKSTKINQLNMVNRIGIKCAQCSLIYTHDKIEQHLITHIQPKYLMPHPQPTGAKKLQYKLILTQQTSSSISTDLQPLEIESFPKPQSLRKKIQPPSQFGLTIHNLQPIKKELVSYKNDEKDLSSVIGFVVGKDDVERQQLTHGVGLQRQQTLLSGRQQISLYRSNRMGGLPIAQRIRTERKVNPYQQLSTQSERTKQYQIEPIKEDLVFSRGAKPQEDRNLLVVNLRKHKEMTPRHQTIITSSAKKPQGYLQSQSTASKLNTSNRLEQSNTNHFEINSYLQTTRSRFNQTHSYTNQFQCEQCHGFHCNHCGSTIPPKYRPWNIQEVDAKIVEFYKQHVYKKNCEHCVKIQK